jgi:hypothetical protein
VYFVKDCSKLFIALCATKDLNSFTGKLETTVAEYFVHIGGVRKCGEGLRSLA